MMLRFLIGFFEGIVGMFGELVFIIGGKRINSVVDGKFIIFWIFSDMYV